jgi:energy-converting hydrogenase Eha subunit A
VLVPAAIIFGLLAVLLGYLLFGQAQRSALRTGSWRVGLLVPAGFLVVVAVAIVRETLGRAAVIAVCVGLCAALLGAAALRDRHEQRDPAPAPPAPPIDELPPSYRFHDGGGSLAGWGLPISIVLVGRIAFHGQLAAGITLGLAVLAAAIGLTIVFGRRRRQQREIIAEVERRAADLPSEDLRKLVEVLEREHGRFEMRRLRRLIA